MAFKKAEREKLWLKVLLTGSSGSGKTYSALRLATGLAKACGGRIAAIDTENGRLRYYADEFDFDDMELETFEPEKFIDGIQDAIDGGYKVLIIDSSSAEWKRINEIHDAMPGSNSFQNWAKVKPRHDKFMAKILEAPLHIIVTARGKDEYVMEDKNGKQTPKKIGLGSEQEKSIEYNYTVSFLIDQQTHIAEAVKDNTHLFEGRYETLTENDGVALYNWANKGKEAEAKPRTVSSVDVTDIHDKIKDAINALLAGGTDKAELTDVIKAKLGTANYKKIEDEALLNELLEDLNKRGSK